MTITIQKLDKIVHILNANHFTLNTSWAWSYQQKFSDLRNFQKKSENFHPAIFARKVRKNI
jgi:hypothetical protein